MPPTHRTIDERTELPPGYRLQAADTSYSVERVLVERWRATPLADKAAQLGSSFRALEALSAAGVRLRYPHASTREIWLGTVSLRLGPALTEDVYGSHPAKLTTDRNGMALDPVSVAALIGALFDRFGIRYATGGAVASTILGEPRSTHDVDILVDLQPSQLEVLISVLEANGFYVPRGQAAEAVTSRRSFNIVHVESAIKVDLFVAGRTALDEAELERRVRVSVPSASGGELCIAAAEDLIAQKLRWYRDGGEVSDRQWRDVLGLLKVQGPRLDRVLMRESASRLAVEDLLARAVRESAAEDDELR